MTNQQSCWLLTLSHNDIVTWKMEMFSVLLALCEGEAIIWTNGNLFSAGSLGKTFSKILINTQQLSFTEMDMMYVEMLSAKLQPFFLGLNVLAHCGLVMPHGDIIWTLDQARVCCLEAPSHYLNQCWLLIIGALQNSPKSNFMVKAQSTILYKKFEKYIFEITVISPRDQWFNSPPPIAYLYYNYEKYPLSPLKPGSLALLSWHVPYNWGSGNSVHQSFTWFLSLNWCNSTFYHSWVPILFQN